MSQPPTRPFESLAWYRDAARNGFQDDSRPTWSRWATGWGMVRTHLSIFACGMVLLYALNLLIDPGARWAGWWILAWIALLGIHAIVVTMLWALHQWNDDAPDEALFVPARPIPGTWSLPRDQQFVHEAEYRTSNPDGQSTWSPWQTPDPTPEVPESERASWTEASAAAWRTRGTPPPTEPDAP